MSSTSLPSTGSGRSAGTLSPFLLVLLLMAGCGSLTGQRVPPLGADDPPAPAPSLYEARSFSPASPDVAEPSESEATTSALRPVATDRDAAIPTGRLDRTSADARVAPPLRPDRVKPLSVDSRNSVAAPSEEDLKEPYHLNVNNIMHFVFRQSPQVTSNRESMKAAQHALTEFRANLSRREPFIRATGDYSEFPERRDSEGMAGETTGGVEMETFDGAKIRLEGGVRGERVEFGEVEEDQDSVETGSGGVVRARVEVPFAGSRTRQNRVISQAFQESTARKAVLNYVSQFRTYVDYALQYYDSTLYYRDYVQAYTHQLETLNALAAEPRLRDEDRARVESVAGDSKVLIDNYQASYESYLLLLLQYIGVGPGKEYVLEERPLEEASVYYEMALTEEGRQAMIEEAFENNLQFRILADAIADSELKRKQAIEGQFDITTFVEGTQFAFGSESFDDRVGGWQVQGGVTFRVNDPRVLTASREKAEAEIRQYKAEILAERLRVQRQVIEESTVLTSYHESRPTVMDNLEKAQEEFQKRREAYLSGSDETISIDDVITSLSSITVAEIRLANNVYYTRLSENELLSATGEVYRRVGLEIEKQADDLE